MGLLDNLRARQLISFHVDVGGLRFRLHASEDLRDQARASAMHYWEQMESYVARNSAFKTSFVPLAVSADAPSVISEMARASNEAGVGPMVCMTGALVEAIATDLSADSQELIVACEGDVFVLGQRTGSYVIEPSGGVGGGVAVRMHCDGSAALFSSAGRRQVDPLIGKARAVGVVADHGATASAAGSAMGYAMHREQDVERALEAARKIPGVRGAVVVAGERIGLWGGIEITSPSTS